jgi:YfiH family protein
LLRCQDNSLVYYRFQELAPHVNLVHGVFTRLGGVSPPPFATLNLGRTVGDSEDAVQENYSRICRTLDIARDSLVTGYQVHSDRVAIVGPDEKGALLPTTDALVTDSTEISLTLRFADCVPLFFFDPVRRVVALGHAGWKGTVNKIGSKVLDVFQTAYDSRSSDIIACIGPSIGPCCYQVGDDVIQQVEEAFPTATDLLLPQHDDSVHLDLWAANRHQLEMSGVTKIEEAELCTVCHRDEFFSHRGDRGSTGRFGAFLALQ